MNEIEPVIVKTLSSYLVVMTETPNQATLFFVSLFLLVLPY